MNAAPHAAAQRWCVLRLDDNGNQFLVRDGLSRQVAEALARDFSARGHKQSYWVQAQRPGAD
ncbi:hypothetical protein JQX08_16410 [Pseudomonas sp. UL073]|uniref:Uncharacterized protein n=1 Tax=Zestomonas insulae TaxID=2809017 RepID=A0ABS2IHS3_9GAMM|nr:hypothetical protein [Pseudomonas insulae]MBM7062295.1 hypothetical protein [Pseudomonas insulae]